MGFCSAGTRDPQANTVTEMRCAFHEAQSSEPPLSLWLGHSPQGQRDPCPERPGPLRVPLELCSMVCAPKSRIPSLWTFPNLYGSQGGFESHFSYNNQVLLFHIFISLLVNLCAWFYVSVATFLKNHLEEFLYLWERTDDPLGPPSQSTDTLAQVKPWDWTPKPPPLPRPKNSDPGCNARQEIVLWDSSSCSGSSLWRRASLGLSSPGCCSPFLSQEHHSISVNTPDWYCPWGQSSPLLMYLSGLGALY